jgi:uncharacterized membrane protein
VTLFDWLKLIHVLAAIVWLGGALVTGVLVLRLKLAEPGHRLGFARDLAFVGERVYAPAAVVSLVFGVWMVLDRDAYEFSQAWILIGLIGLLVTAALATGFMIPQTKKAIGYMESGNGPAAGAVIRKVGVVSRLATLILLVALWAMVFKPGLDSGNGVLFGTLLMIHLVAVMYWLGGGVIAAVFLHRVRHADRTHQVGLSGDMEKIGPTFAIVSLIAAAAGIWMVIIRPDFAFGDAFVIIGIAGFVLSSILGGAILTPAVKKLHGDLEAGRDGAAGMARVGRILTIDHLILLIVVGVMIFRPGA